MIEDNDNDNDNETISIVMMIMITIITMIYIVCVYVCVCVCVCVSVVLLSSYVFRVTFHHFQNNTMNVKVKREKNNMNDTCSIAWVEGMS